jgi:hypothetical protein
MEPAHASFESLPYARSCRRVDFDFIELRETAQTGGLLLVVSGITPWADLRVSLEPLVYPEVPEFWGIEVVGRLTGPGLCGPVDFCAALRLGNVLGHRGIEIVGARRSERKLLCRPVTGR